MVHHTTFHFDRQVGYEEQLGVIFVISFPVGTGTGSLENMRAKLGVEENKFCGFKAIDLGQNHCVYYSTSFILL